MPKEKGEILRKVTADDMPRLPQEEKNQAVSGNGNGNSQSGTAGQPAVAPKTGLKKLPAHLQSLIDKATNKTKSIKTSSQLQAEQEVMFQVRDTVRPILDDGVPKLVEISEAAWQRDNVLAQRQRKELLDSLKEFCNLPEKEGGVYNLIAFADAVVTAIRPEYHSIRNIGLPLLADVHFLVQVGVGGNPKSNRKTFWLYGQECFLDERLNSSYAYQNPTEQVIEKLYRKSKVSAEKFEAEEKRRLAEMQKRLESGAFSVADLQAGKKGEMVLFVPGRTVQFSARDRDRDRDRSKEQSKTVKYKGGHVLIRSNGEMVEIVDAVGGFEKWMKQFIEAGVTLPVEMIFKERISGNQDANRKALHATLYAGINCIQEKLRKDAERQKEIDDLRTKQEAEKGSFKSSREAALSEVEFLLDKKPGGFFLDYGNRWFDQRLGFDKEKNQPRTRRFYTIIAFLERNQEGKIKVADCPARLADLFADFREFKLEGENFSGVGQLGFMLREVRHRVISGLSEEEKKTRGLIRQSEEAVEEAEAKGQPEAEISEAAAEASSDSDFAKTMMESAGEDPTQVVPASEEKPEGNRQRSSRVRLVAKKKKSARRA